MTGMEDTSTRAMRTGPRARRRALVLGALAAWAIAVPWIGRALGLELDVPTRLEVIDHVVPGAVVFGSCTALSHPAAAGSPGSSSWLGVAAIACLSGVWITATHAVLLPEAIDGVSPWGAALLHLSAGPPIAILALWLLLADGSR
jgi:hypothetical protein